MPAETDQEYLGFASFVPPLRFTEQEISFPFVTDSGQDILISGQTGSGFVSGGGVMTTSSRLNITTALSAQSWPNWGSRNLTLNRFAVTPAVLTVIELVP